MTFSSRKRLAFSYGRQAAKKKLRFAPALDSKMQQTIMRDERHWDMLMRAWFSGYEMQMRIKAPDIANAIKKIMSELYSPDFSLEWSEDARSAKRKLEKFGI